jgi:hypothetical protein
VYVGVDDQQVSMVKMLSVSYIIIIIIVAAAAAANGNPPCHYRNNSSESLSTKDQLQRSIECFCPIFQ